MQGPWQLPLGRLQVEGAVGQTVKMIKGMEVSESTGCCRAYSEIRLGPRRLNDLCDASGEVRVPRSLYHRNFSGVGCGPIGPRPREPSTTNA